MTIALIGHAAVTGAANGGTSAGINTTDANLLVVLISKRSDQPAPTLSDNFTNVWVQRVNSGDNSAQHASVAIYDAINATVGAGHTITTSGASTFTAAEFLAFSGASTSPFDLTSSAFGTTTTQQPGAITPSAANALLIAAVGHNSAGVVGTVDSGFTAEDGQGLVGGVNYGLNSAFLIQTSALSVNPTFTVTGASEMAALMVSYLPSVALPTGGGTPFSIPSARSGAVSLGTWTDPLKLNLRSRDAFFGGAGRGPVYDYPNPPGPIPAIELRTWVNQLRLTLQSKDAFFGLAGNPQHDWPVPKAPARGITLWTWAEPLKILLQSKDQFFGLAGNPQTDWPVPKAPIPGISLRTWIDPLKLLAGADVFFGLAGNPQRDWPNPRAPAPLLSTGWLDPFKFELNGIPAPFTQGDWPNPKGPLFAVAFRTWLDPFKGVGTDAFYGLGGVPQFDWPLPPRPAPRAISLWTWSEPLKLGLQSQDAFFGLAGSPMWDWPVPPAPRYPSDLRTFVNALELQLQSKDTFFGLAGSPQFSWPNPGRAIPPAQGLADAYKLTLNGVPVPFVQGDWPNPNGAAYAIGLRTWIDPFKGVGTDTFFGLAGVPQFNWPNPGRPAPLLQSWSDQYKFTLNAIPAPFTQGSWPNPAGPVYALALKTWIDPFKGAGTDTFFGLAGNPQYDWPLPTRQRETTVYRNRMDVFQIAAAGTAETLYFARRRLRR